MYFLVVSADPWLCSPDGSALCPSQSESPSREERILGRAAATASVLSPSCLDHTPASSSAPSVPKHWSPSDVSVFNVHVISTPAESSAAPVTQWCVYPDCQNSQQHKLSTLYVTLWFKTQHKVTDGDKQNVIKMWTRKCVTAAMN